MFTTNMKRIFSIPLETQHLGDLKEGPSTAFVQSQTFQASIFQSHPVFRSRHCTPHPGAALSAQWPFWTCLCPLWLSNRRFGALECHLLKSLGALPRGLHVSDEYRIWVSLQEGVLSTCASKCLSVCPARSGVVCSVRVQY